MPKTELDFDFALDQFITKMVANYNEQNTTHREKANFKIERAGGRKFLKLVSSSWGDHRSVHSFIVLKDVQCGKLSLKAGDILKAASWAAPELNFIRGNIFAQEYGDCRWTGAM